MPAQTISEAQGSYPSLYVDGETVEAETMLGLVYRDGAIRKEV